MSDVQCNCNGGESSLTCPRCNPGGERIRLFASLPHPAGSPEAIEIIWKDRDAWKARAEAAEKRARDAEATVEGLRRRIVEHRERTERAENRACLAEVETIAAVVAWLEKRAYDGNEHEIALMVDAIARGDWRPKGREGGE